MGVLLLESNVVEPRPNTVVKRLPAYLPATLLLFIPAWLYGCDSEVKPANAPPTMPLESVFTVDTIRLEEAPGDSIGEIRLALELGSDGRLLIVERYRPRIHLYAPDGRLAVSAGSFGAGPGEFKNIGGAAVGPDGDLYLVDNALGRVTVLDSSDLSFVRVEDPPVPPIGPLAFAGEAMVLASQVSRRGDRYHMVRNGGVEWSVAPMPDVVHEQPYWINFVDHLLARVGDRFITSNGIMYPLTLTTWDGKTTSFGSPPASFRPIPDVKPRAFPQGPRGRAFELFLASFDVVGGIHPLGTEYVAVVHSQYHAHPLAFMLRTDLHLDLYRIRDTTKVVEDVALPGGARVLAGGERLYILTAQPPSPWTVVRAGQVPMKW
jgi:hypothetical protein